MVVLGECSTNHRNKPEEAAENLSDPVARVQAKETAARKIGDQAPLHEIRYKGWTVSAHSTAHKPTFTDTQTWIEGAHPSSFSASELQLHAIEYR